MNRPSRLPLKLHTRVRHDTPIGLHRVELLRRLSWGRDPLEPASRAVSGAEIDHPVLSKALADAVIGTWSVGPGTIRYLQKTVQSLHPSLVLEFGSGVSTLCIAQFLVDLADTSGGSPGRVISIEQSEEEAGRTEKLLGDHGLGSLVDVIVAPLRMGEVEGRYVSTYTISHEAIEASVGPDQVDLVFIDGPAAESGARYGTIPLVRRFLRPGAVFLLDDALRDGELSVAAGWSRLDYLAVEGIIPLEHGLLRGTFVGPGISGS